MDNNTDQMTIENFKLKIEGQAKLIKELTNENEELYHQYNHLIIRNGKLLKRIDDFQRIINDLHIRIEELQLINGNMMQLNDNLRNRKEVFTAYSENNNSEMLRNTEESNTDKFADKFDLDEMVLRWKSYPGQNAQNGPNLRKQVLMLLNLYTHPTLRAADLFNQTGVGGVTGARYVSILKKFGLIQYTGARKKGHYRITQKGVTFIEQIPVKTESLSGSMDNPHPSGIAGREKVLQNFSEEQKVSV